MPAKPSATPSTAVIGGGYWGKNLVRNFHRLDALKLICDSSGSLLDQFQSQYPGIETCLAYSEVIQRDDIQGVVIATPAETHFSLAREALLAKKHVYVEKPLALREEDGQELIRIAGDRRRTLMVGHLLQYHPVFVRLKELVAGGELGKINYIYSHRLNLGKIRREENILWSFAPHDISMILSLAEEYPEAVFATGGNYLHQKIADVTTTHLEFPSGLRAHIFVSWLHPYKDQKLVVVGERKMAVFDDTKPWQDKLLLYPHRIKWEHNIPVADKAEPERIDIPEEEPLFLECRHFLACITDGTPPVTDGSEGVRVLRILNAAQRSLDQQGVRIALDKRAASGLASLTAQATDAAGSIGRDFFAHPTAVIDEGVSIGAGTKIWHFSHVLTGSAIGEGCNLGQNVVIGPDVSVGKGCKIQNNVSVFKGVTLEDGVFCGPSMVFTNVNNPRSHISRMGEIRPTCVREGATLGANCTILCGHTIGRYAFVGAGAVVTTDVPDCALMLGNPAKIGGWMCRCGLRLHFASDMAACESCGTKYRKGGDAISEVASPEGAIPG